MARRLALLILLVLLPGCNAAYELFAGPKTRVIETVRRLGEAPLRVPGEDTELELRLGRPTVSIEGDRATVFVRADVHGRMRGVPLRCLCVERLELRRGEAGWAVVGFPLPRLKGVVEALDARHAAFERQDAAAYARLVHADYEEEGVDREGLLRRLSRLFSEQVLGQQQIVERHLRVDGREAIVTETYRIRQVHAAAGTAGGTGADGAKDPSHGAATDAGWSQYRARYRLRPTPGGWRFVGGLL